VSHKFWGDGPYKKNIIFIPKAMSKLRISENFQIFDFKLDECDLKLLDGLTTEQNLSTFKSLYLKCVTRDTPLKDGWKTEITID